MIRTANLMGSVSRNAGGLYESVRRLMQSLQATGMEVCVFSNADEHTAADVGAWAPVTVRTFKPHWPWQFGYSPEFRPALEAYAPDLTHTHGLWMYPSVVTNHYFRRHGVPYIISAHGMLDPWAVRNSRWRKAAAYFFYESAHLHEAACLRALCESEARAIRQLGFKNPIAIIPNGIDLPLISKPETRKPEILKAETLKLETLKADMGSARGSRAVTGVPPGTSMETQTVSPGTAQPAAGTAALPQSKKQNEFQLSAFSNRRKVLLYLGRIHPKKGLVNLLKAWATVNRKSETGNRKSEEWVLAIAGWDQGGHEAELKRLATELGMAWMDGRGNAETRKPEMRKGDGAQRQTQVTNFSVSGFQNFSLWFLGPQFNEAKTACYQQCEAFILPSFSEGVPMVVLEAWAYRKPVLMTPQCNLPTGFAHNAAIRIETTPESIAQGLEELFRIPDSGFRILGENGRRLVSEQFAWPVLGQEMARLYQWMLGRGDKPACVVDY